MSDVTPSDSASFAESLRCAQTVLSLPAREQAIVRRILIRMLLNMPPGTELVKEQVAGWLKAEGAAESVIYSYLNAVSVPRGSESPDQTCVIINLRSEKPTVATRKASKTASPARGRNPKPTSKDRSKM